MLKETKADKTILKVYLRIVCMIFMAFIGCEIFQMIDTGQFSTKSGETIFRKSSPSHFKFELMFNLALFVGGLVVFVKAPVELPSDKPKHNNQIQPKPNDGSTD